MPKESAGGIIVGQGGKLVLVRQNGNSWSFPKGQVEQGESLLETAKREIKEETGITDLELIKELGSYERNSIGPGGVGETTEWGSRTRSLFLLTTNATTLTSHDKEVTEARWVTLVEASKMLTHPKDKAFLESVRASVEAEIKNALQ